VVRTKAAVVPPSISTGVCGTTMRIAISLGGINKAIACRPRAKVRGHSSKNWDRVFEVRGKAEQGPNIKVGEVKAADKFGSFAC
jgi:hypothetical protein